MEIEHRKRATIVLGKDWMKPHFQYQRPVPLIIMPVGRGRLKISWVGKIVGLGFRLLISYIISRPRQQLKYCYYGIKQQKTKQTNSPAQWTSPNIEHTLAYPGEVHFATALALNLVKQIGIPSRKHQGLISVYRRAFSARSHPHLWE